MPLDRQNHGERMTVSPRPSGRTITYWCNQARWALPAMEYRNILLPLPGGLKLYPAVGKSKSAHSMVGSPQGSPPAANQCPLTLDCQPAGAASPLAPRRTRGSLPSPSFNYASVTSAPTRYRVARGLSTRADTAPGR